MEETNKKLVTLTEIKKVCLNERTQPVGHSQLPEANCLSILQDSPVEMLELSVMIL